MAESGEEQSQQPKTPYRFPTLRQAPNPMSQPRVPQRVCSTRKLEQESEDSLLDSKLDTLAWDLGSSVGILTVAPNVCPQPWLEN